MKLLGVDIDSKLSFKNHVSSLCTKAGRKLTAFTRLVTFLTIEKSRLLMKTFIELQFNYCPLVWMFHNQKLRNKINKIHERSLRIVYNDDSSSFEELLSKDNSVSIHHRNIQSLAIEMYKSKNNLSPQIGQDIFQIRNTHPNMRTQLDFVLPGPKTVNYGTESLKFMEPKIWNILPKSQGSANFKQI